MVGGERLADIVSSRAQRRRLSGNSWRGPAPVCGQGNHSSTWRVKRFDSAVQ